MLFPATAELPAVEVRKLVLNVEEIWHDNGPRLAVPLLRGSVAAAVKNPYAGGYVENIQPMMEALKPLGREMAVRLVAALGRRSDLRRPVTEQTAVDRASDHLGEHLHRTGGLAVTRARKRPGSPDAGAGARPGVRLTLEPLELGQHDVGR